MDIMIQGIVLMNGNVYKTIKYENGYPIIALNSKRRGFLPLGLVYGAMMSSALGFLEEKYEIVLDFKKKSITYFKKNMNKGPVLEL